MPHKNLECPPRCTYLCIRKTNLNPLVMKVKVTKELIEKILNNPEECKKAGVELKDPWWIILLKVIAYAIGLILGGAATASCATVGGQAFLAMATSSGIFV